jgi:hypothetical protein
MIEIKEVRWDKGALVVDFIRKLSQEEIDFLNLQENQESYADHPHIDLNEEVSLTLGYLYQNFIVEYPHMKNQAEELRDKLPEFLKKEEMEAKKVDLSILQQEINKPKPRRSTPQ